MTEDDRHLSPKELAERWCVAVQTLANWRSTGKGPRFLRVGGGQVRGPILYRLRDVVAYEDANTIASTSEAPGGAAGKAA